MTSVSLLGVATARVFMNEGLQCDIFEKTGKLGGVRGFYGPLGVYKYLSSDDRYGLTTTQALGSKSLPRSMNSRMIHSLEDGISQLAK